MKKLAVFLFVSVFIAGTVFAQTRDNRPGPQPNPKSENSPLDRNNRRQVVSKVTIEGVLKLDKGVVAVTSGDSVYYVPILNRYIGFIDGLKEGTKVSVEGSQIKDVIRPVKVTINGKSYDFPERGNRDNGNRFSQGREPSRQPRNLNDRGRQMPFGRNGFGGCCR